MHSLHGKASELARARSMAMDVIKADHIVASWGKWRNEVTQVISLDLWRSYSTLVSAERMCHWINVSVLDWEIVLKGVVWTSALTRSDDWMAEKNPWRSPVFRSGWLFWIFIRVKTGIKGNGLAVIVNTYQKSYLLIFTILNTVTKNLPIFLCSSLAYLNSASKNAFQGPVCSR